MHHSCAIWIQDYQLHKFMLWFSVILFEDGGSRDKHFEQSAWWERRTYRTLFVMALRGFKHFAQKVQIQYPAQLDWECMIDSSFVQRIVPTIQVLHIDEKPQYPCSDHDIGLILLLADPRRSPAPFEADGKAAAGEIPC